MNHKIVLVGSHLMTCALVERFQGNNVEIVIATATELLRSPFEHEPIRIYNFKDIEAKDPIFYENEPSKFIGKPKNNFKKR